MKPGGYLLAFGGTRTYHHIACAIEDAGFEIRDCIMWLYGSGFPKSMNIGLAVDKKKGVDSRVIGQSDKGKATNSGSGIYACNNGKDNSMKKVFEVKEAQNDWKGWGTCLKPAYEPIIVARKPFKGSLVDNVLEWGLGGLNIDECRIPTDDKLGRNNHVGLYSSGRAIHFCKTPGIDSTNTAIPARFPANVIHDGLSEEWSRYFYCAKASKRDRDEGLDEFDEKQGGTLKFREDGSLDGKIPYRRNVHPTVKPTSLMRYLVRLVTPKGGTVLDPFMGSGSTGKATMIESKSRNTDYKFVGIDIVEDYLAIAEARIKFGMNNAKEPI